MFVDKIKFSWLSDKELLSISKLEVSISEDLNSNYLGATVENNCLTCGLGFKSCPGHFGHYKLCYPLVHPLLSQEARMDLKQKKKRHVSFRMSFK